MEAGGRSLPIGKSKFVPVAGEGRDLVCDWIRQVGLAADRCNDQ
jgi:hypothetical protein